MKRLYYFSMFDGYLQKRFKAGNARLESSVVIDNIDFLDLVADALSAVNIGYTRSIQDRTVENPNRRVMARISSRAHPILTTIWNRIYLDGHKVVDPHMLTMLDPESLAIIFMADGGRYVDKKWNATPQYALHTNGLNYGDNMLLKIAIRDTFGLEFNIDKKNQYFQLRLRRPDSSKFESIVAPFITPSFQYKLGR